MDSAHSLTVWTWPVPTTEGFHSGIVAGIWQELTWTFHLALHCSLLLGCGTWSGRVSLLAGLIRIVAFIFTLVALWVFLRSYISFSRKTIRLPRWLGKWSSWPIICRPGIGQWTPLFWSDPRARQMCWAVHWHCALPGSLKPWEHRSVPRPLSKEGQRKERRKWRRNNTVWVLSEEEMILSELWMASPTCCSLCFKPSLCRACMTASSHLQLCAQTLPLKGLPWPSQLQL